MSSELSERVAKLLESARLAREERTRQREQEVAEREQEERERLEDEWQPYVLRILKEIDAQLGTTGPTIPTYREPGYLFVYRGEFWTLKVPECRPVVSGNHEYLYQPMKLRIDGLSVPVMCWSNRADVNFAPAEVSIDDESDPASLWIGGNRRASYQIGNEDNLLIAIEEAAGLEERYQALVAQVEAINEARRIPEPAAPEPEQTPVQAPVDYWEVATNTFADYFPTDGANLIAACLLAVAQDVRRLTNTMENRP